MRPCVKGVRNARVHILQCTRMRRRKGTRRCPDTKDHAHACKAFPRLREIVDMTALRRMMIEPERIIPDDECGGSPRRYGVLRGECTRLINGCGMVDTAQDDFQQSM